MLGGEDMRSGKQKAGAARRKTHSLELKLQVLQQLKAGAAVSDVCRAFGLAITTVALWRRAYAQGGYEALFPKVPGPAKRQAEAEDPRREAVLALKQANPEYGTRRIRDVLKRFEALPISETEVRRMLQEAKLLEAPAKTPRPEPGPRRFERAEPNQLWQSDIFTFLLRRHERVYLCAFLDDHSRFVVGWSMARHQKEFLVREALDKAIAKYGVPKEVLTDNGRQYTVWRGATRFEEELRRQGIRHLKSRPQHPQTLGKVERFWKTLWDEFLSRTVFASYEDCEGRLALYLDGYNFQRPHQALQGLTPADRFFRAAAQVRAAVEAQVEANSLRLSQQQPAQKPFYIVGKLGDRDVTISAARDGVRVQFGKEAPQTISLQQEEGDHEAEKRAQAPAAADTQVAEREEGAGPDRPAAHADAFGSAERADTGDRRDRAGADLPGPLLPAGGTGAAGDPGSDGAGSGSWPAAGDDEQTLAARAEAERAGGGQAAAGEAPLHDTESAAARADEDNPGTPTLGQGWQERFAALDEPEVERWRLTDLVERAEHPLSWPRKLAGEAALSDAEARRCDVHHPAGAVPGDRGALRDDLESAGWNADADGGGGEAGDLHRAVPQPVEPSGGGGAGSALAEEAGAESDAAPGAEAAGGERAAEEGEPPLAGAGGDDRSADDGGGRDPARPGAHGAAEEEDGRGRQQ